jgi:hypothetical protein
MKRKSIYVDDEIQSEIDQMVSKNNWSIAHAGFVLLQSAVKERNRQRNKKANPVKHNTTDPRSGNAG